MTKPERCLSYGRLARVGSPSNERASARALPNPATQLARVAASAPPAIMMSTSSASIIIAAVAMEWPPVAQALARLYDGPIRPHRIVPSAAALFGMTPGMKNGETARGPRAALLPTSRSKTSTAPMPVDMRQPERQGSSPASGPTSTSSSSSPCLLTSAKPAMAIASTIAPMEKWVTRP